MRCDVLHRVEVEVRDLAREQVAGLALARLDARPGDREVAVEELGDCLFDERGVEIDVGVEEEQQLARRHRCAGVAPDSRHPPVHDGRPELLGDFTRGVGRVRVGNDDLVGDARLRRELAEKVRQAPRPR